MTEVAASERCSGRCAAYPVRLEAPSQELIERLPGGAEDEVEERLEPVLAEVREAAPEPVRRGLVLVLGAHYGVESVLDATGLTPDMPPDDVHAMARGPLAAGGSAWLATSSSGASIAPAGSSRAAGVCSTSAARPRGSCASCRRGGTTSSGSAVTRTWERSSGRTSTYRGSRRSRRRRTLRSRLLITTQGFDSLAHYMREAAILAADAERCAHALLTRGHWLGQSFPDADFGIVHPEWGMAYTSPEWLLRRALPDWRAALYEPGALEGNQDLWVFIRR